MRTLLTISVIMLALGLALPMILAFLAPTVSLPVTVWDFLQIGGLAGSILFYLLTKISAPKKEETP